MLQPQQRQHNQQEGSTGLCRWSLQVLNGTSRVPGHRTYHESQHKLYGRAGSTSSSVISHILRNSQHRLYSRAGGTSSGGISHMLHNSQHRLYSSSKLSHRHGSAQDGWDVRPMLPATALAVSQGRNLACQQCQRQCQVPIHTHHTGIDNRDANDRPQAKWSFVLLTTQDIRAQTIQSCFVPGRMDVSAPVY